MYNIGDTLKCWRYFCHTIGLMVWVFANGSGDWDSIPAWVMPKTQTMNLIPLCIILSIKMYGSRVKWSNLEKGVVPSFTLALVANVKGAFQSPLTTITNFTLQYILAVKLHHTSYERSPNGIYLVDEVVNITYWQ